jgi:hypothetical protein
MAVVADFIGQWVSVVNHHGLPNALQGVRTFNRTASPRRRRLWGEIQTDQLGTPPQNPGLPHPTNVQQTRSKMLFENGNEIPTIQASRGTPLTRKEGLVRRPTYPNFLLTSIDYIYNINGDAKSPDGSWVPRNTTPALGQPNTGDPYPTGFTNDTHSACSD